MSANAPSWWSRFESKFNVDYSTGCWLWTAYRNKGGHGRFYLEGKDELAHRVSYLFLIGEIPKDLELDHVKSRGCQGAACVNPQHLEPVTHKENMFRTRKTHCQKLHPYNESNTMVRSNGSRACRQCDNDRQRLAYWAKHKPKAVVGI